MVKHTSVQLPVTFANRIDYFIEHYPEFGYISRAEFVKEACRRLLDENLSKSLIRDRNPD